jgi:flagellar assembly factor FliW
MPRAHTEQFGELEYAEDSTILFPRGLPGFETCHRFVLLDDPELAPLVHLQSLEIAGLCFLALPIRSIDSSYETSLVPEDREALGLDPHAELSKATLDLALLSAAMDGRLSANLLAPIVIHLATRKAVQAVRLDSLYSHQHELEGVAAC